MVLVDRGAEGVHVANGDDEGRGVGKGRFVVGGALDRAPPRAVGLHEEHVRERGEIGD